ncbi:hypothetical protein B0H67DRAFT_594295 [Lasiosphaeris hirsuta]|uniref:Uncharacterized protein n=1 Tax=Lasiosphaeris hirsuta TaxID=260670 RepID=A0AA39ZXS0_9PEZI|nr:hypothetical protein B0H67DRAFT_594295 [Lasiosphaeris hirsuta]
MFPWMTKKVFSLWESVFRMFLLILWVCWKCWAPSFCGPWEGECASADNIDSFGIPLSTVLAVTRQRRIVLPDGPSSGEKSVKG